MKKESLSASMPKLIMAVCLIVGIGALLGAAGWAVKNKSVKIRQPQVLPAAEPEAANQIIDETADWKTYRNEEYGFEMKYPLYELFIIFPPEAESILFNARTSSWELRLRIWDNSKKLSLEDYLMNVHYIAEVDPPSKEKIPSMLKKGQGKIANMEYFEGILGYPAIFILKDQYIFEFLSNHYDKEFDQILSTFKFIEK